MGPRYTVPTKDAVKGIRIQPIKAKAATEAPPFSLFQPREAEGSASELEPADPDFYKIGYVRSMRAYGIEFKEGPDGSGVCAPKDVEPLRRARVIMEIQRQKLPWMFFSRYSTNRLGSEVQIKPAKKKPGKSLYARWTDPGLDLQEAAKRLKIDWDTAAEIDDAVLSDESEVPPVLAGFLGFLVIK